MIERLDLYRPAFNGRDIAICQGVELASNVGPALAEAALSLGHTAAMLTHTANDFIAVGLLEGDLFDRRELQPCFVGHRHCPSMINDKKSSLL
jgi:hypothetical protein